MLPLEPIYKGATRPAMKFGVPLVPLVSVVGAGMLAALWGGLLVSGWIAAGVVLLVAAMIAWMRQVTHQDDQRFRLWFLSIRLRLHDHNHATWHARSFSPTVYRGVRDAWLR